MSYKSFDALEDEINAIERKLRILKRSGQTSKALETRKQQAEFIKDAAVLAVQEEKMSFADYLDLLRLTIDHDEKLAEEVVARRGEEGRKDYAKLVKRINIMKAELKGAEEQGEPE